MHWSDLLRYIGLAFQLVGIGLAAYGISETRREWTQRPGVLGATRAHARRAARRAWQTVLVLVARIRYVVTGRRDATVVGMTASVSFSSAAGKPTATRTVQPSGGLVQERLQWLERQMIWVIGYADQINQRIADESQSRKQEVAQHHAAWTAAVGDVRRQLGDFAGGGLRLQAAGVAVLVVGTILATIPDEIASIW